MTKPGSAILSACSGPVAFFTDFDGTLVEIADSPDAVALPDGTKARLDILHDVLGGAFAIVTGRTISAIDLFFSSDRFTVAGSHGAEFRHAGKIVTPDPALAASAATIATRLRDAMGQDPRILIETKPAGVALHYRAAPERRREALEAMESATSDFKDFHFIEGKKVYEARQRGIDKGQAITRLMRMAPFAGRTPLFLGDDVTDEDGFVAVQEMGGIGIRIGSGATAARFTLSDVSAAHSLIDTIASRTSPIAPPSTQTDRGMAK